MYATDSTKADTLFFTKISAAAAEGENPDNVRLLKWSQMGVRKYPNNPTLLGYLNKAYSMSGQTDSVMAVTNRIIAKDTTETGVIAALAAAQALIVLRQTRCPAADSRQPAPKDSAKTSTAAVRPDSLRSARPTGPRTPSYRLRLLHVPRRRSRSSSSSSSTGIPSGRSRLPRCCTPAPRRCCSSRRIWREPSSCFGWRSSRPIRPGKCTPQRITCLGLATPVPGAADRSAQAEKQKSCDAGQAGAGAAGGVRLGSDGWAISEPAGSGQESRHHQEVQPRIKSMLKAYCKGEKKKA